MEPGENWHAKVRKLRVTLGDRGAGEGQEIGTIHLDLEPRPGSFRADAHLSRVQPRRGRIAAPAVALVATLVRARRRR